MKKIAFVLAVLLFAAPAWADVVITAAQVGDTNQVTISYEVTAPDVNLPRAFGLDITVTAGVIKSCTPAMVGECNDVLQGYGIFPGTIQIDVDGTVTDDGTPVAPSDDPGALGGIDTNGITVEMGSLYVDGNAPGASGLLCTITVTEDCTVNIAGNAARCGEASPARGVVMEDPDELPAVTYVPADVVIGGECMSVGQTIGDIYITQAIYDLWVSIGKPSIWCCVGNSRGDANDDGFTNPTDVVEIINALGQPTSASNCHADLNRDGYINPTDVVQIINNLGVDHGGPCP